MTTTCPHCLSQNTECYEESHPAGYGGTIQVGPYTCFDCGAREVYPGDIGATDEEVYSGWHLGDEGHTEVKLTPGAMMVVAGRRKDHALAEASRLREQEQIEERKREVAARELARKKLIDEALF